MTETLITAQPKGASISQSIAWASGSVATATISNVIALFGLFYLNTIAGLSIGMAGTLILASKLYDAFTDPVMGALSDRTHHSSGRRRVYVGVGALLTGLAFALFFGIAGITGGLTIVAALLLLLFLSTAYTIFSVPYLAMPPDLAPTYDGRTQLMSFRLFFIMLGVLIGTVGGPKIVSAFGEGVTGFAMLGVVLGIIITLFGSVSFFGTKGADFEKAPGTEINEPLTLPRLIVRPFHDLIRVLNNQPFLLLTIVKLLQLAVLATVLACTPYFFSLVLERQQGDISNYLFTFTGVGIIAIPLLRYLLRWLGKRTAYIILLIGYAIAMASWYLWEPGEAEVLFYARAVAIGFFSTGTLLCALALLPDTMEYDKLISNDSREGVMSGAFTLVEKVSGALGPFLVAMLLESQGFVEPVPGETIEQSERVLASIKLGVSLLPAALTLACIPFLLMYRLDEQELKRLRRHDATA